MRISDSDTHSIWFCVVALASVSVTADSEAKHCPPVTRYQAGICINECTSDNDCFSYKKCCGNGCGTVCQYPVKFEVPHAGVCPVVNDTIGALCIDPPPCDVDQECPEFKKCCYNGCSKLCTTPEKTEENKVGLCKGDVPVGVGSEWNPMSNCSSSCSSDKHCTGDEKCCWVEECGGYACSEPAHVCEYNGDVYMDEDIYDEDGCSYCSCFDGQVICAQKTHCELTQRRKLKMIIFSLIGVVVFCIVVALVVFIVYRLINKNNVTHQDQKATMPQQNHMMNQDKAVEAGALPPKV
ncbi:kielin/chordin-like protein [Asterias rubens]|uniref:kielin/chordin-like protein n=1 Tax=Asterias rubens TaxID=7604 RepID=UPI001454FCEB|nr:kielin/chordin-like protein [Asterias rubens]